MKIEEYLGISIKKTEVSNRLRELITDNYPTSGRFKALEEASGISASRWKNFYYKKQEITQEMLDFWINKYANDTQWLISGIKAPNNEDYPFLAKPPIRHQGESISDRLIWAVKEWASPRSESLFHYLAEKSKGKVTSAEWADLMLERIQPTAEMVAIVCEFRPYFAEWIITGSAGIKQVDPSDKQSIEDWNKYQAESFEKLATEISINKIND